MSQTQTLTIQKLLTQDRYIIPIYQRNYAWGDGEIELLLTDIYQAMQRDKDKNYYIGSLVVAQRVNNQYEVIDGQQRLTTLTLLMSFLRHKYPAITMLMPMQKNISFEYRQDSEKALESLFTTENWVAYLDLPDNFLQAKNAIQEYWQGDEHLVNFILEKVEIIRTEVPPQTDLNHYFEIMNTRGEQLEKHEILKARLMSKLTDQEQLAFADIWDACSDMSRYMVMGFDSDKRRAIFGKNWQTMPTDFQAISKHYQYSHNRQNSTSKKHQSTSEKLTISEIISDKFSGNQATGYEKSERFNAVIDFPNFLMHVWRIYLEGVKIKEKTPKKIVQGIPLDEKLLLKSFKHLDNDSKQKQIKDFAMVLLQCRWLFDQFIIKSDTSKEQDDHWSLLRITPNNQSYHYVNTFDNNETSIMLLSMFHVSHPARIYKNWLYAVMRWLYKHRSEPLDATNYSQFLENLSDGYYFGYYGKAERNAEDFFDVIFDNDFTQPCFKLDTMIENNLNNVLNLGTSVPNFIFNRLDYLLWKHSKSKPTNFRFTFRSSVEHFYPQNPDKQNRDTTIDEKTLHSFGNLCLISSSMNSKFTNNMPLAKKENFGKSDYNSLKLSLMMAKADRWNKAEIKNHDVQMKAILNRVSDKIT